MKHAITYISLICTIILVIAVFSGCTKNVNGEEINYVLASGDIVTKYTGQLVGGKPEGSCTAIIQSSNSTYPLLCIPHSSSCIFSLWMLLSL